MTLAGLLEDIRDVVFGLTGIFVGCTVLAIGIAFALALSTLITSDPVLSGIIFIPMACAVFMGVVWGAIYILER